jgi:hypothetical protein
MTSGSTLLLAIVATVVICSAVSAVSKRPDAVWNYYHFDGRGFVAGPPADSRPFLAVRDNAIPAVLTRMATAEPLALPAGKGALAGICYIQNSGGKLAGGSGYSPCPRASITISSGDTLVASVPSDENGFFISLLAAGRYRIGNGVFEVEAVVEKGTTSLVPLRAGKRMVD